MVEADGDGEFGTQAERFAGLAFGEENAAAKVFAGHVEERIGRLDDGHVDGARRSAAAKSARMSGAMEG